MLVRLALPLMLILTGCADEAVPTPTAEENAQLDEAENMLDNFAEPPAQP